MNYYEVKKEGNLLGVFEFPNPNSLVKYLAKVYPVGSLIKCRQVDEEEAEEIRAELKKELTENVEKLMAELHWS